MGRKNKRTFWNLKDIIILQFIFFFIREICRWTQEAVLPPENFLHPFLPVLGNLLFMGVVFFWLFFLYQVPPPYLGITWERLKSGALLGLKLGVPLVLLTIFLINFPFAAREEAGEFSPLFFISDAEQLATSLLYFILYSALFFFPALGAELYFRGIIGGYFHRLGGHISGAFFSSLFFALFWGNIQPGWVLFHFLLGLALYYCYLSRESILPGTIYLTLIKAGLVLYAVGWNYFST